MLVVCTFHRKIIAPTHLKLSCHSEATELELLDDVGNLFEAIWVTVIILLRVRNDQESCPLKQKDFRRTQDL